MFNGSQIENVKNTSVFLQVLHTLIEVLDEPQGCNLENSIYLFANAHCYAHGLYVKDW
jgi:hypothetical protein